VNAAYLMLTTAWLAGADPAPVTPAAPTGPVVAAPIGGGCGGGCGGSATDACCDEHKQGCFAKLKAKFHKHNECGCEQSCAPPKPVCCPAPKPVCCPAPAPTCCHAAPVSSGCGCEEPRVKLCDKIKAKFKKHNDCGCESSCNSCGGASGVPTGAPAEAIPTKPSTGGAPMPIAPKGSVMNGGMIVTPVVAPRLTNEQPF
jgi:hypothetical protein